MFDRPMLRKFALVTGILVAIWLFVVSRINFENARLSSLAFEAMIFLPMIWFVIDGLHRKVFRHFFTSGIAPFRWQDLAAIFVALLLVGQGLDSLLALAVGQFNESYIEDALNMEVIYTADPAWLNILSIFFAVVAAPVIEEILFRGLIFSRLSEKWNPTVGILVSSLLFGVIHFEGIIGSTIFGITMCLIYYHSKNLWVPIVLHVANNLFAVLWMWLDGQEGISYEDTMNNWPFFLATLLALPALVLFWQRYRPTPLDAQD